MENGPSLAVLVKRTKAGDRSAFDELVGRHRGRIVAFIHSRLGAALEKKIEVEDILQESLLRAYQAIAGLEMRGEDSFFRWLSSIAEHVILEAARHLRRDRTVALDLEDTTESPSPSKVLRRNERFDRLQRAFDLLSPEHRQVIFLVRVEGLPVKEAARRMERSPHAVSNLLLRATRRLKELLGSTESLGLPDRRLKRMEDSKDDSKNK